MPCECCNKKGSVQLKCNYCPGSYCVKCLKLEVHNCEGKDIKEQKNLNILNKSLTVNIGKKIDRFSSN